MRARGAMAGPLLVWVSRSLAGSAFIYKKTREGSRADELVRLWLTWSHFIEKPFSIRKSRMCGRSFWLNSGVKFCDQLASLLPPLRDW